MVTTIKLSDDTKQALNQAQIEGESFDETVARLLGESKGQAWTEQEIESIARATAENMLRQLNTR